MPSKAWRQATFPASVAVATGASVGSVCPTQRWIFPVPCARKQGRSSNPVKLVVKRGMCMPLQTEALIEAINVELEAGNWSQVVALTTELYACVVAAGDMQFAELIQDLHWIANDALVHPIDVAMLVSP